MKNLVILFGLGLIGFTSLFAAADEIDSEATVVITPEQTKVQCNGEMFVCISLVNNADANASLSTVRLMGLERSSVEWGRTPTPETLLCYLRRVNIETYQGGRKVASETKVLPIDAEIKKDERLRCLISLRTPATPGVYTVKLSFPLDDRKPQFSFPTNQSQCTIKSVSLENLTFYSQ